MNEYEARRAPARWVAYNPKALAQGARSFHINAFLSPWVKWTDICKKFLDAKGDQEMMKTFYNLELGLPYEYKDTTSQPEVMFLRREHYEAEVPNGVLVITIGIDTQDNRLEYEVKGWGRGDESWGIQYGVIPGRADEEETWKQVDALLDREWRMENGKRMKAAVSFMDTGGHFYDAVLENCTRRRAKRLYPIRGDNKDTGPLVHHTRSTKKGLNLYILNVYVGKREVLYNTGVANPGPRYMHYPDNEDAGYDEYYFRGLISEQVKLVKKAAFTLSSGLRSWSATSRLTFATIAGAPLRDSKLTWTPTRDACTAKRPCSRQSRSTSRKGRRALSLAVSRYKRGEEGWHTETDSITTRHTPLPMQNAICSCTRKR